MAIVPFRIKKGQDWTSWKAVISGKTVELAPNTATLEEAKDALMRMIPQSQQEPSKKVVNLNILSTNSAKTVEPEYTKPTDLKDSNSQIGNDKPKPGELRKNGLAELSPARLAAFRTQVANAIASGNVSLDRALVSIFRDKVPVFSPDQYMLLSTGWELACEQYFVNGVPPAWIIILLGNATVIASLVEKSEPKPPEDEFGRPIKPVSSEDKQPNK
jgi:hypothetical protein